MIRKVGAYYEVNIGYRVKVGHKSKLLLFVLYSHFLHEYAEEILLPVTIRTNLGRLLK